MSKDLSKLSAPLFIDQIDFRIQSINKGGYATILAYKDARVDIKRLNEVCGLLGWKREHTRDNHNCIVSIWDDKNKQWVGKEDTGTESMAEAQKGLASDSFKRACFNWGIGLELYDYPVIQIKLKSNEYKTTPASGNYKERVVATWDLQLKNWVWYSEFTDGVLTLLTANDGNTDRFTFGKKQVIVGEISGTTIDPEELHLKSALFGRLIDEDAEEHVIACNVAREWALIDRDMQVAVFNDLKKFKIGKRQMNTILKDWLNYSGPVE